ncbi:hypothetical protein HYX19_00885 [Candidatus Woesearchaeota archaeon]|nr:hypothetical protein [Candidatus Woesearchaeota archaeon]
MKTIHLLKKLERLPLFTGNDVSKIINKSPEYVKTLLYRLNKQNFIKRIEKGKYTVYEDPMLFSSHIITPSYFSLWTAFRFYNMTQQQPFGIFVISAINKKKLKFQNTEIMFFKTKHMFGYKKERYADFDIFIAEKEKAVIDALLFKIPIQDIIYALESEELNFEKLAEYAKKTNNSSLIKRLGYILQSKKEKNYGLKALDNNYIPLDYLNKKKGKKDSAWKLIINTEI